MTGRPLNRCRLNDPRRQNVWAKAAGLGVALHAKPVVAAEAEVRIDHGDLTALLYLQGYTDDEFVR